MSTYRIELRSFNIGVGHIAGPDLGIGFAHNFLVLVEIRSDGSTRPVAQFHGHSHDRRTGEPNYFDALGGGQLKFVEERHPDRMPFFFGDSGNHPKFILFEGSRE